MNGLDNPGVSYSIGWVQKFQPIETSNKAGVGVILLPSEKKQSLKEN